MSDDLDYYDEKLKNHVVQEVPIYNKEAFDVLKKRYPNKKPLTLYRGINFRSESEYLDFMKSIKENKGYKSRSSDSFSEDEKTVLDFALTQPTYFLNEALMISEDEKTKNKERLSGYCGVIVEIEVPENSVVDISESGLGIEDEAIIEPFSIHDCKVSVVESYKMMVEKPEFSINRYIKEDFNNDFNDPFFKYILHHHKEDFNQESRHSIFNALNNISSEERINNLDDDQKLVYNSENLAVIEVEDYTGSLRSPEKEIRHVPLFNRMLFQQAHEGYFTDQDYQKVCKKAEAIVKEFTDFYVENNDIRWKKNNGLIKGLSCFCSEEVIDYYKGNALSNKANEYKAIGKEGEKINKLPAEERAKAIDEHKDKLVNFLNNLISELPEDKDPSQSNSKKNKPK